MNLAMAMDIGSMALKTALLICMPLLGAGMVVGLAISIFQTATSIQEQTMTFAPKIFSLIMVLLFAGSWVIQQLMSFTLRLWEYLVIVGGGS